MTTITERLEAATAAHESAVQRMVQLLDALEEAPQIGLPTIYVRSDGHDSNVGDANTPGAALATIAGARELLRKYALNGETAVIQLGTPGTYKAPGEISHPGGVVHLKGDPANPASYIITHTVEGAAAPLISASSGSVVVEGVLLRNNNVLGHSCLAALNSGDFVATNTIMEATNASNYLVSLSNGGVGILDNGCQFRGAAAGAIVVAGGALTIRGNVHYGAGCAFTVANVTVRMAGSLYMAGGASLSGTATGVRYAATTCGVIWTNGGGANYFPGSVAGTIATGAQYV